VVDGFHENDGCIVGKIRILSTPQKAEEFIKKHNEETKMGMMPGDSFMMIKL
jgi:hypothetical protein